MTAIESAVRGRTIALIIATALAGVGATLMSAGAPQSAAGHGAAASIFKERCQTCHGADGAGTTLGKTMQIPNLRSNKIQRQPDSSLLQVIREGKSNMPSFKSAWTTLRLRN
jgi:cytochrome c6